MNTTNSRRIIDGNLFVQIFFRKIGFCIEKLTTFALRFFSSDAESYFSKKRINDIIF